MTCEEVPQTNDGESGAARARTSKVLAVVSLVCGILSAPLSLVMVGALVGFVGLVLGVTQLLTSRAGRGLAWTGVGLSTMGLAASTVVIVAVLASLRHGMSNINVSESFDAWIGAEAPDFIAPEVGGGSLQLANYRGKRVILDFSSPNCAFCEREAAGLIKLRSDVSPDELAIIGVSGQDLATLRERIAENHINYPIVNSANLPQPYSSITVFPAAVIIDRNGVIQKILIGYASPEELKSHAFGDAVSPK